MEALFDTDLIIARKKRAKQHTDEGAAFLMKRAAEDLAERLSTVDRHFEKAAAIFCLTPHAADALKESGKVDTVSRVEADPILLDGEGVVAAPETLPLEPQSLDLAVSLLTLHETNDTPGMLAQIRKALKPDGLFLGAMAGAGTLQELREALLHAETELSGGAAPRVSPFADIRDVGGLLQRAGFALPVADLETLTVRYANMFDLMRDLRAMGATSALRARSRKPASRALFIRAAQIYAERFADPDGRIRATFNIVWISGWAPHASQQKPLAPGSAKISLKDVLEKKG
ncbi:type 11 methyltransferase [Nitratireductor indicus C115]|uniref:Type 11 methyltransferase n=1 Tax=Nitratireductor indicus C115 TaxID=1231190 RepID=K2MYW4_9HYPH|nr:methyltransferase domain-containing protein [Nitratireductor indicus]EKF40453.1 type 11 methyltransferase [Nitratireductor indicus C115]SFQ76829.1 Methyltransferase domain-containing protein [Nitratireductor indicus]